MEVIAHRGCNREAFENSFDAFEKSIEAGAKRIELDVVLTRDGHAVINHDDHLMHTTGKNLSCSKLHRSEFKGLVQKGGGKIPFLDEVMEQFLPRIELNIEIKGASVEAAAVVAQMLKTHPLRHKVVVSSFFPEPLIYFRQYCPDIRRACLTGDDELNWPYFSHLSPLNFMMMTGAQIIHPRMDQVSENFMDQCLARNWQVYTWAPMVGEDQNKESWWSLLKALGVHGHCTNYPRELLQWISDEEKYHLKRLQIENFRVQEHLNELRVY